MSQPPHGKGQKERSHDMLASMEGKLAKVELAFVDMRDRFKDLTNASRNSSRREVTKSFVGRCKVPSTPLSTCCPRVMMLSKPWWWCCVRRLLNSRSSEHVGWQVEVPLIFFLLQNGKCPNPRPSADWVTRVRLTNSYGGWSSISMLWGS